MTMIESVARGLYEHQRSLSNISIPSWEDYSGLRSYWYDFAYSAIKAMREPTEKMKDNGGMVRGNHQPSGSPKDWDNDTDCAGIWRAMIDKALDE